MYVFVKFLRHFVADFMYKENKNGDNFYKKFISKGDLVFDIGANIGNRTFLFSKLGAKVIAVEPQKSCFYFLKFKSSFKPNIKVLNCALGSKKGESVIYISKTSAISTLSRDWISRMKKSKRFGNNEWNIKQKVSINTFDNLIKKYGTPKFCKIDVEGFELEVIKGLSKKIKIISFEFATETIEKTEEIIEILTSLDKNYKFNFSEGESLKFKDNNWRNSNDFFKYLKKLSNGNKSLGGDIYARLE